MSGIISPIITKYLVKLAVNDTILPLMVNI